jgi:hypothetical protein
LIPGSIIHAASDAAAARQTQLRVDDDEVHLVISDAATVERAKRVVRLADGALTGEAAASGVHRPGPVVRTVVEAPATT